MTRICIDNRKGVLLLFAVVLLFSLCSFSKDNPVTLHGVIMDSQCAYNVHSQGQSHALMTKGAIKGAGTEEACTLHCVKDMGGSYVLVVKKDVYKLDDQDKLEPFAGKKVKVNALLGSNSHSLHALEIQEEK